jgi:hypothetical protein
MRIPRASVWRAFCAAVLLCTGAAGQSPALAQRNAVALGYDQQSPQVRFAVDEIRRELAAKGAALLEPPLDALLQSPQSLHIALLTAATQAQFAAALRLPPVTATAPQSYAIRKHTMAAHTTFAVIGADAVGAMYGGLDLAEAIRLGTLAEITDSDHQPYIEKRGIKFNIPLDARTPSYSDNSDAAQANIPEMWSGDFWREFLDEMARQRFNVLTLWNLHPFPSLVKVPEYPEVALNDVTRTTLKMDDTYWLNGHDMYRPEMADRLETVKRLTIDEKIQFWREVMQYAYDRGIEVYLFTWNIFTWGAEGKHGITAAQDNPVTIDYFRTSVRETVLTYPLLAGIGITAGEQMQERRDEFSKEQWLWKTYGEGIRDALQRQPQRHFRVIHRYHQTAQADILTAWKEYPSTLDLSFKYAIAHMYSVPNPPFIKAALPYLSPTRRTWLTLRNDDIYSFRWGDPAFARAFIRHLPGPDKVVGFYMGPDGYNWGREFLSPEPETPRQLVIKKQWYSFMLWGRLSYEPTLPDALFERTLAQRFPEVSTAHLFTAWSEASKIFPLITRFFWGDIDLRWFPEACLSHPQHKGWYTVRHFIAGETMPESGILSILAWRERILNKQPIHGSTPLQVAEALQGYATTTLQLVAALRPQQGRNKELRLTLGDLEAMAHLGNYYAAKIRGAAELALFDKTGKDEQKAAAVRSLEAALRHWQQYAAVYSRQYKPQLLNRVGFVDIPGFTAQVEQDVEMAKGWQPGMVKENTAKEGGADTPFKP